MSIRMVLNLLQHLKMVWNCGRNMHAFYNSSLDDIVSIAIIELKPVYKHGLLVNASVHYVCRKCNQLYRGA
jgi:hypothetical protein